ncbi:MULTISPECIES: hypothetical protein [Anaeromyxobacter]|uniref:hypothetical protein n=1 Tax=Anaeromyxobacter TaxID=161492 RepID=UPI001F597D9C|nr:MULTISPECIES: hypothetical protein [unclassified Anaeromyxobacter]
MHQPNTVGQGSYSSGQVFATIGILVALAIIVPIAGILMIPGVLLGAIGRTVVDAAAALRAQGGRERAADGATPAARTLGAAYPSP